MPSSQADVAEYVSELAWGMEADVMAIVARALASIHSNRESFERQPADVKRYEKVLARYLIAIREALREGMGAQADADDEWAAPWFQAREAAMTPWAGSKIMSGIYQDGLDRMLDDVGSMIRTSAIGMRTPAGELMPFDGAYRAMCDEVIQAMTRGEMDREQAVSQIVGMMADSGLKVTYASGRTRELYSAVETNIRDGFGATMSQARMKRGEQFGADGVEITAHAQCAPDHLPYQGRQYSMAEYYRINQGLGRPIVTGANCRHRANPVILGLSVTTYSDKDLGRMQKMSEKQVTFTGRSGKALTMSTYDATQYMRGMERDIRRAATKARLLESAGADTAKADQAVEALSDRWSAMQEETKIRGRVERTRPLVLSRA